MKGRSDKMRVAVAMSGGVDSSVAAWILRSKGYQVVGLTMLTGQIPARDEAVLDAAGKVCRKIGIPHDVVNVSREFEDEVVQPFCLEYSLGRTPNPCVVCNRSIKFGVLLACALEIGATHLATGHYCRLRHDPEIGRVLLYKAKDEGKDQSYVLYSLKQEQLRRVMLPLGEYKKNEVKELALKAGLGPELVAESQEICFVEGDYREFLAKRNVKKTPGLIVDKEGRALGRHQGIVDFTVGQRRGLGLACGRPLYVTRLDPERNEVVVGFCEDLMGRELLATRCNFIPFDTLEEEMEVEAKIRYTAKPAKAIITPAGPDKTLVRFFEPQRAITPGQSVVFYDQDLLVGGGVIDSWR